MTISRVTILGAAIALTSLAGTATAADLGYGAPSVKDTYAAEPMPAPGRTWYLRSFTGFSNYESDEPITELHTDAFSHISHDYENGGIFGFGIGVQVNRWLRLEGTAEYRGNATFHGLDQYNDGVNPPGTNEYTAIVDSWVGLTSAYADLFTWCGVTPFVGVGIGAASVDVKGMKDVNVPRNSLFHGDDKTSTNFAWAVHAGAAYEVNDKVTLDIGYRYMELGDVSSGRMTAYDDSSTYRSVDLDDLRSHDLMVGMRWKLDRPAPSYSAMK